MIEDSQNYNTTCLKHNLPNDVFIKPDKSQPNYQKQVCRQCAFEFHDIIPVQLIKDSNQTLIERFESQAKSNSIQMSLVIHQLISIRQLIGKQIENLINELRNQIQNQDNLLKQCRTNILQKEVIEQLHQQYLESQNNFQKTSVQQIEIIKQNHAYDYMIKILQEMDLNSLTHKKRLNKISYASIVVAGCDNNIRVFEFKNEQFIEIQEIQDHTNPICCLLFMKKSNQFISGSFDNQIKIWQQNNNQWINTDTLIGHKTYITCIIISQNEDLIISGSDDKSIIFWRLQNKKWNLDQQINCSDAVRSLSLNHSKTKLISALYKLVEVFEYQISKWCKVQEINKTDCYTSKLCFISDSEFVVSHIESDFINFYSFNQANKQFEIVNKLSKEYDHLQYISLCEYFPIQFIKQKNLLIIKNSQYINAFRKLENNKFILDQSIKFDTEDIAGSVSDDGQYLLTSINESKELELRKLQVIMQ